MRQSRAMKGNHDIDAIGSEVSIKILSVWYYLGLLLFFCRSSVGLCQSYVGLCQSSVGLLLLFICCSSLSHLPVFYAIGLLLDSISLLLVIPILSLLLVIPILYCWFSVGCLLVLFWSSSVGLLLVLCWSSVGPGWIRNTFILKVYWWRAFPVLTLQKYPSENVKLKIW